MGWLHVQKIEERRKDIMDYVKAFVVGGIICAIRTDFNGKNKVYAASENREKTFSSDADETDVLPTGIAGVVSGMNDNSFSQKISHTYRNFL